MDEQGFLNGYFLAAMPGMGDERFHHSIIYICSHSSEGAMGFVLNKPHIKSFMDLIIQLDLVDEQDGRHMSGSIFNQPLRHGGPVEQGRGFVLHSDDYHDAATTRVGEGIYLTATLDILRLLEKGEGPTHAFIALGCAGWGSGQLEREVAANVWLTIPANADLLFDLHLETLYERILASIGIDWTRLVGQAGHS